MDSHQSSYKRILLIDDNKIVLMAHLAMLSEAGYSVDTASCGQEALEKFEACKNYDLILTDYNMPEMTGSEVAQRVLSYRGNKKSVTVIAITSECSPEVEKTCKASGMKAVIPKPLKISKLVNTLDELSQSL